MNHVLKIWPPHFEHIRNGERRFDIRRNDRRFRVGDVIKFSEFIPSEIGGDDTFTGRHCFMRIRFIHNPEPGRDPDCGLVSGYVGLDLDPVVLHAA